MLCKMIKVRIVIQTTLEQGRILEANALLKECAEHSRFVKTCFPMAAFGSQRQILIGIGCLFVAMLWGDDRLLVKGLKHMAGRFRSLGNQVMDGFKGKSLIEATDITLLRHRRTMQQLLGLDFCRFLNGLAKELLMQDLDDVFMRSTRDGDVVLHGNASLTFEVEQYYVTRPLPATAPPAVTAAPAAPAATAVGGGEERVRCYFFRGLWVTGKTSEPADASFPTTSTRSLKAEPPKEDESDPAKSFMMRTAVRSLDEAFAGKATEEKNAKDSKDKKKKKDSKDNKKKKDSKKKKKKGSSSSSSSEKDESSSLESEDVDDSAALFGLTKKDMQKNEEIFKIDDLPSRMMGFVLSQVTEMVSATDVYECGGELDPRLSLVLGFGQGAGFYRSRGYESGLQFFVFVAGLQTLCFVWVCFLANHRNLGNVISDFYPSLYHMYNTSRLVLFSVTVVIDFR
ncbi:unnamed protein product [Symbiodinium necroappetens]|uniref:Uncharacterized protein n=1 Tax=Symbiodinium necroappetens TaxID=1628268 RepID=A0A812N5L9_9DINO|nr:unnamed protein product [Symbiodinium necroappetens]